MSRALCRHRRRAVALVSVFAILVLVASFTALFLSTHATRVSNTVTEVSRLRAQAAAQAACQLTLWNLKHDANQQACLARVLYEHDTSYAATPLFQINGTLAGAAFHVDLWPGPDTVRLKATANSGGTYAECWTQMRITLADPGGAGSAP